MQIVKYALGTALIAIAMVVGVAKPAQATNTSGTCDIAKLKLGEATGQNMIEQDGKLTASFIVSGTNCTTPVTLAVWQSPSASGQPINDQKLFSYKTQTFGQGMHQLTTTLPDCYWQADLLVGDKPTAPDGTANYAYQNGQILSVHPLRDYKYGGNKVCEEPEEPETPKEPTKPQTLSTQTPTTLPSTGAGAIAGTFFGVSASAGLAHALVRRFRK